ELIIQEYLEGPSYSIEVVGKPGTYQALQVTDLGMDAEHDCNRVTAPVAIDPQLTADFETMALTLAEALELKGIMDLEVIHHDNQLKLLEIDARLPSQTPMAVLASTGINMVELLAQTFVPAAPPLAHPTESPAHAVVEHIQVNPLEIEVLGEHIMATDGPLTWETDFFGATEALTSYAPGKTEWVATLVFIAPDPQTLDRNRRDCYRRIRSLNQSGGE
ncbi:MAG: ATP-grasp domain-containing protein, partial [Desulfobacterales bacterium]|nr:ATP-grasp domain-containing protein [Desulfobacterales bacterium]